jgi:hypothetical protein
MRPRPTLVAAFVAALCLAAAPAAPAAPAAKRSISLTAAKAKVLKHWNVTTGTYAAKCARTSSRKAVCYLVRTAGTGAPCGRGEAKLSKRGRVTASSWGYECSSIPARLRPPGVALPTAVDSGPAPAPAPPGAPAPAPGPQAPAPPAAATTALSGTYVCLTGIVGIVREAGPTSIEPIPVPATGIEPPMKFTLKPDGTYDNITFGAAYANDPKWKGTYTVTGDRVKLVTPPGTPLFSYELVRRTDTAGTEYLIEDAPENERYKANACRRIA